NAGRVDGRNPARARFWSGRSNAPAARTRDRRRARFFTNDHVIRHAGDLSLARMVPGARARQSSVLAECSLSRARTDSSAERTCSGLRSESFSYARAGALESLMRAMVFEKIGTPLASRDVPRPKPGRRQLLVRVSACGVCRTDLHIVDNELPDPKLPLILGHQIVGRVEHIGESVNGFSVGHRVGIPWLGWTDGECAYCRSNRENLCDHAQFTGYNIDGGYAEFTVADARYCFHLPDEYDDVDVAPLLCAGMLGYRSYRKTGDAKRLGIYGFGNAA